MMRDLIAGVLGAALLVELTHVARAEEAPAGSPDLARQQLERVLGVLRLQPSAASSSCLDSLREMHKTEDQVKTLEGRAKDPDKALAQDVLESDYENSKEMCGADAVRLCSAPKRLAGAAAACAGMKHDGRS